MKTILKELIVTFKISILLYASFSTSVNAQVISANTSSTVVVTSGEDFVINSGVTLSNTSTVVNAGSSGSSISIENFTNNGSMTGSTSGGKIMTFNSSVKTNLINNGTMLGKGGIEFNSAVTLTNNASKSISGTDRAIHFLSGSSGTDLTNNGSIQGNYSSIRIVTGVTINSLTNGSTGTIGGTGCNNILGIELQGTITTLTNNGSIRNCRSDYAAIYGSSGAITTLKNYGTINNNNSSISISGTTVTNLYNSQNNFKFVGNLPSNYYIFIDGSNTGKITFSSFGSSTLVFGIDPTSTLSNGTYSAVVNGIASSNISSGTSGTFGGKSWTLTNSSGTQWDLVVSDPDTTDPTLSSSTPSDNATSVAVNANIVLNFSESVDVESGNITIKKTSGNSTVETIDVVTSGQVTGTGTNQITINPSADFDGSTEYYVLIDATAFDDSSSNSYAGISSTTALSFITVDTADPTLSSSTPSDNATDVAIDANIILNFSESVDVESGNITIKKTSDNSTIETIDVTSGQVTGTGTNQITINPTSNFDKNVEYYVLIDATAFDDSSINSYAGISSTTALSFTTIAETIVNPVTDKDVIGSIDAMSSQSTILVSKSINIVSSRIAKLNSDIIDNNTTAQNIKLNFGNAILTSLANNLEISNVSIEKLIPEGWNSWSEGAISFTKIGDKNNSSSKDIDSESLAFGFDKQLNNKDQIGFALQYGQSDADVGSGGTQTETKNYNFSVYRSRSLNNNNFVDGIIGFGLINSDVIRKSGSNTLTGSRDGKQIFSSINYGKTFNNYDANVTPTIRFDLGYIELDPYTESGTNPLTYSKQTIESGLASLGFKFNNIKKLNQGNFKPFISTEYTLDFSNTSDVKLNYVSDTNTYYSYTSSENSKHLFTNEIGFEYISLKNFDLSSSYKRVQGNESEHSDMIKFRANFKSQRETEYAMTLDGSEDFTTGLDINKKINGFDFNFNASQAFNKNLDKQARITLSRKY